MIPIKQLLPTSLCVQLAISGILLLGVPTLAVAVSDEQAVVELMELSGLTDQIPRLPNEYMTLVDQLLVGLEVQRLAVAKGPATPDSPEFRGGLNAGALRIRDSVTASREPLPRYDPCSYESAAVGFREKNYHC